MSACLVIRARAEGAQTQMNEDNPQQQRADLLRRSRDEHERLEAILATLGDEQMTTPGVAGEWTVKDHLAHITWWEQRVIRVLGHGEPDPLDAMPIEDKSTDGINADVYAQNRDRSLADVRASFDDSYQQMLRLIETVPDEVFADQRRDWISGNADGHYEEHRRMFEAWLQHA